MEASAQVAICLLMLAASIPLHEGGHYFAARRLGYESQVIFVLDKKSSGFVTISRRPYEIKSAEELEKAVKESLGITACGVFGLLSPLTFLVIDPEVWFVFAGYTVLLFSYAVYELMLTIKSWKHERLGEFASLWWLGNNPATIRSPAYYE